LVVRRQTARRTNGRREKVRFADWNELWDVLRWYAHNRGYDGNLRWSGNYVVDGYSSVTS